MTKLWLALGFVAFCFGFALIVASVLWYIEQLYGAFADEYVSDGAAYL